VDNPLLTVNLSDTTFRSLVSSTNDSDFIVLTDWDGTSLEREEMKRSGAVSARLLETEVRKMSRESLNVLEILKGRLRFGS